MNSKKKISRLLKPSMRLYFAFLVIFVAAAGAYGNWILAGTEALVVVLLFVYSTVSGKRRHKEILKYIDSVSSDTNEAVKDTFLISPLPMVIFNLQDGRVMWSNEGFKAISGDREHFFEVMLSDAVPGLDLNWLIEGEKHAPDYVSIGNRTYQVYGNAVKMSSADSGFWGVLYWVDSTDFSYIQSEYLNSRPIVSLIVMDNYEELFKGLNETAKSTILAGIDKKVGEWADGVNGYLSKSDRDRYIFIFEQRYLQGFIDSKFSLLETIRELVSPNGVSATLSIGIGKGGSSLDESLSFAALSVEMALSRGGDQVVIKDKVNFEFYGGHSSAVERRTKVKSRVMASALGELISDASCILIMGHRFADLDCIGAAAGLCCIARKREKPVKIVHNPDTNVAMTMVDRLTNLPEYENVFITPKTAMLIADSKTLLIIVDTNRPDQVESEPLLVSCVRVAVIDHHRRASDYISNAAVNFHEPYASSASELVTELLSYLADPSDLLKTEAEAVLSGIVLDTKNFSLRTGSRTFEAAAFLRRAGADIAEVKKAFQSDFDSTVEKYQIIQNAKIYRDGVAVSVTETQNNRIAAAKAADELLNIAGITASFVVYEERGTVNISARSLGEINVQVILEKLGGGGNMVMAGAQIKGKTFQQISDDLYKAIDWHLDEISRVFHER